MTHPRKIMRDTARAAIQGNARFSGWTAFSAWAQDIDEEALPCFGVATPEEQSPFSSAEEVRRETDLVVQLRRIGGDDLEDDLDDDSVAAEAAVLTAFEVLFTDTELLRVETPIEGDGARRIGKVNLQFRVTRYTAPGSAT